MTTEQNSGEWDSLLTEEAQEGEEYIQPNIELELPVNKRKDCRDIVMEIRKFGVSQRQMLYIIYLLSLELEDNKTMKAIAKAIGENRKNVPVSPTVERSQTPTLILPGKD
jgi:hypothetical protein